MNEFLIFLKMGMNHILDINGLDHILFVIVLCSIYTLKEWKTLLILVTAFTLGHSLTLALSGLELVSINQELVEFLIPITIFLTAVYNISFQIKEQFILKYVGVLFFGLIHGLGFSNFFKAMMMGQDNIVLPLLAFNIGVEVGQFIVLALMLCLLAVFSLKLQKEHRDWKLVLNGAGLGASILMIIEKNLF